MTDPTPKLVYARDLRDGYETRQQHARSVNGGTETRVARGVYTSADLWKHLDATERYLAHVRAVAYTRRNRPVLSHWSAAAVHGLPIVGALPREVHTTIGRATGGRSRNGVVAHARLLADGDVVEVAGMLVTSIARTVLDVAAAGSFMVAVSIADSALHVDRFGRRPPLTTRRELFAMWERSKPHRGFVRAKSVLDFADTRADSPLESVSRVNMRIIGCPRPLLQSSFSDYLGFIGETDFDWPDYAILGEADGGLKYLDPAYRNGRSAEEVVRDEKVREDRLRALPRGFTRWDWSIALHPA
ncbi:MAG: hypothetical protein ABIW36_07440, partial [Terrimesophilobacter sp.]